MASFYPSPFLSAMVYFATTNSYLKYFFLLENHIVVTNMSKHKKFENYAALFRVSTAVINLAGCSLQINTIKLNALVISSNLIYQCPLFLLILWFCLEEILKCFWICFRLKCNNTKAPKIHCSSTTTHVTPTSESCKQQTANLNPHFSVTDKTNLWLNQSVKSANWKCLF